VGRADLGEGGGGHPVLVALAPDGSVTEDLDEQPGRQGVDDRDADTVQAAGGGKAAAAQLPAGVEHGEDDLDGGLALRLDDVHRDPAAVVDDADAAVLEDGDVDGRRVTGEGLVDGVVDDLVHQVVQAPLAGGADVHARALAN